MPTRYFYFHIISSSKLACAVLLQVEKSLKTATKCAKNIFTMTV